MSKRELPAGGGHVDLSSIEWVSPFDAAALAAWAHSRRAAGHEVTIAPPTETSMRRYLVDLGLDRHLDEDWGRGGGSATNAPLLPLTRLERSESWDELVNRIWPELADGLGHPGLATQLFDILGELVDNATTHGASPTGTFVCLQRYTGSTSGLPPSVWVGVADAGVGIPAHLRRRPKYARIKSDEELIRLARQPWVTGTADRRGWGLVEVFDAAARVGTARLVMRSGKGEGRFLIRRDLPISARYRPVSPSLRGTWVHIEMAAARNG